MLVVKRFGAKFVERSILIGHSYFAVSDWSAAAINHITVDELDCRSAIYRSELFPK